MRKIVIKKGINLSDLGPITLCMGNFDGVHRGHQTLIKEANENGLGSTAVFLFDKNPADIIGNGKSKEVLMSLDDKIRFLGQLGVEYAFVAEIDKNFFNLTKTEFIDNYIKPINPSIIVVGEDYRFGKMASGTPNDLKELFDVHVMPLLEFDGKKISTQTIIKAVKNGDIEIANEELGHQYEVVGKVVKGFQNGRKIGFPTANLSLSSNYVIPKIGVYTGYAYSRGIYYQAIINVGNNPTVGKLKSNQIEVFLKDFDKNIYDETLYVGFYSYIRGEKKFNSLEELKEQLKIDLTKLNKR